MAQPPLTRTCRAIREETLPIFYGLNRFVIKAYADNDGLLARLWLTAIGAKNRSMLRRLLAVGGRHCCCDTEHGVLVIFDICAGLGPIEVMGEEWEMCCSDLPLKED